MNSVDVIRAAIFGTADSPYTSRVRDGRLHVILPISKSGTVPENPPKTPFYQIGLCSEVLNLRGLIAPSNLRLFDIESVTKKGEALDLDDGIDELPELFFDALGVINDEISQATGFDPDKERALPELLTARKPTDQPRKEIPQITKPSFITEKDLTDLGLDVNDLAEKGLTIELINRREITLEQLQQIAFQE